MNNDLLNRILIMLGIISIGMTLIIIWKPILVIAVILLIASYVDGWGLDDTYRD